MGTRPEYNTTLLRIYTLGYFILLVSWPTEAQKISATWNCTNTDVKILVHTEIPFQGIIYAGMRRNSEQCSVKGVGAKITNLTIPLVTNLCEQTFDQKTQETKLSIWLRFNPNLEILADRLIIVTCVKDNIIQLSNGAAILNLNLYSFNNEIVLTPVLGDKYILRAELTNSDALHDISVGECKAFSGNENNNSNLTDGNGCPVDTNIMSAFAFNQTNSQVDALIYSMFRYPSTNNKLFIQCIVYVCPKNKCSQMDCKSNSPFIPPKEASRLASSLVAYVQDPGYKKNTDCVYNSWLLGLCIAFGVLFLIMLIINIFMCTAMSCTCTKKVLVEEEIEDYDPYKMGWVPESTYSNRYGSGRGPYSNTSTLESRAPSTSSDQYAVVNSPPSRFSAPSTKERLGSSISNTYYSSHVNR